MDIDSAVRSLGALAQQTRLAAFRLLVRAGSQGLPAGEIAQALGIPHNTLSTHLATLVHGGLVSSERQGRSVIYRVDFDGTRGLLGFLVEDCCQGAPEVCRPALDSVLAEGCSPMTKAGAGHETTAR